MTLAIFISGPRRGHVVDVKRDWYSLIHFTETKFTDITYHLHKIVFDDRTYRVLTEAVFPRRAEEIQAILTLIDVGPETSRLVLEYVESVPLSE